MQYIHVICLFKFNDRKVTPLTEKVFTFPFKYYLEWLQLANLRLCVHYIEVQNQAPWLNVFFRLPFV